MSEIRLPMKDVRTSARGLMVARGFVPEAADQILDDLEAAVGEKVALAIWDVRNDLLKKGLLHRNAERAFEESIDIAREVTGAA